MRRKNGLFDRLWFVLFGESALESGCRKTCHDLLREIEAKDDKITALSKKLDEKDALIDKAVTMLDIGVSATGQHSEGDWGFCNGLRYAKALLDGKEPEYFRKATTAPDGEIVNET